MTPMSGPLAVSSGVPGARRAAGRRWYTVGIASRYGKEAAMSADPTIDQLYEQQIKALPRAAKLRLLARIAAALVEAEGQGRHLAARDVLAQAPGGRAFSTAAEVSAYLAQERGAWDS